MKEEQLGIHEVSWVDQELVRKLEANGGRITLCVFIKKCQSCRECFVIKLVKKLDRISKLLIDIRS